MSSLPQQWTLFIGEKDIFSLGEGLLFDIYGSGNVIVGADQPPFPLLSFRIIPRLLVPVWCMEHTLRARAASPTYRNPQKKIPGRPDAPRAH